MDGEGGAEEGEDLAVVESGVSCAAEEVDADAEGVDIVHADVVGDHASKYEAAKDEREDRDADACCGGEEPNEEDKGAHTDAEPGGNVNLGEHVVTLAVKALF